MSMWCFKIYFKTNHEIDNTIEMSIFS